MLLLLIAACVFIAVGFGLAKKPFKLGAVPPTAYEAAGNLLTPAELAFWRILQAATPARMCVHSKVRLADIIKVPAGVSNERRAGAFNRIQSKHIDFVVCDAASMKILCAIELHDRSHEAPSRRRRDEFVREALEGANVPFIEIKARRAYSVEDIRSQVTSALAA